MSFRIHISRSLSCAFLLFTIAWQAQAQECSTPLPSDVSAPALQADSGGRSFLGVWGNGKWDGFLCHTLVVESLTADNKVVVVYSHGVYAPWYIRAPAFYRQGGFIDGETLHLDFPQAKARAEYRLVDGKLQGKYISQRGVSTIVMTRK
jgi:hypothetical protein